MQQLDLHMRKHCKIRLAVRANPVAIADELNGVFREIMRGLLRFLADHIHVTLHD